MFCPTLTLYIAILHIKEIPIFYSDTSTLGLLLFASVNFSRF